MVSVVAHKQPLEVGINDADVLATSHTNSPKYRCPRCLTRTCSLACSRRHKVWSQCSGVRDPAAYLRRSELATESAFDRDFNFITGVERHLERAERDAENRGIPIDHEIDLGNIMTGQKRKHPNLGPVKGEAAFLRGAENGGVAVVRAPRGMTRNKQNTSKWHPKYVRRNVFPFLFPIRKLGFPRSDVGIYRHKCLSWTVEWIIPGSEKIIGNYFETTSIADAYDHAIPRAKGERISNGQKAQTQTHDAAIEYPLAGEAHDNQHRSRLAEKSQVECDTRSHASVVAQHRHVYFYLHRPRTSTRQPVVAPLLPQTSLAEALRGRTVLEFPTIYVLPYSPETLRQDHEHPHFLLEESQSPDTFDKETDSVQIVGRPETSNLSSENGSGSNPVDIENVDEKKIFEVLKKDLYGNATAR